MQSLFLHLGNLHKIYYWQSGASRALCFWLIAGLRFEDLQGFAGTAAGSPIQTGYTQGIFLSATDHYKTLKKHGHINDVDNVFDADFEEWFSSIPALGRFSVKPCLSEKVIAYMLTLCPFACLLIILLGLVRLSLTLRSLLQTENGKRYSSYGLCNCFCAIICYSRS